MKMPVRIAAIGAGLLCLASNAAYAAEVRVVSADALRAVMKELGPRFERTSGHRLSIAFSAPGAIAKRVQHGEAADVVVTSNGVDALLKDGRTAPGDVAVVARTGGSSAPVVYSAAVLGGAREVEASRAFVNFLRSPEAAAVIKARGMQPARWGDEREAPAGQRPASPTPKK
jgi:ABC-type molybdate transport system substrate-binding protein